LRARLAVVASFERRRRLADATMQMRAGEAISEGDAAAQLVTGTAVLGGESLS